MWLGISLLVLVVAVIAYAEWKDHRGPGRGRSGFLKTFTGEDTGELD